MSSAPTKFDPSFAPDHAIGAIRIRGLAGTVVRRRNLRRETNCWAVCHGIFNPVLFVDEACPVTPGFNAMICHETFHAMKRHKLKEVLLLLFLGWTVFGLYLWACFRRQVETDADRYALSLFADGEYRAFLSLHANPTSWWGRWKYGATRQARYKRATGRDWTV